jgi:mannose-6-phosphate isomerase-like protein (cupin superfamily)
MRPWMIAALGLCAAGCRRERTDSVAGPPLTIAPSTSSLASAPSPPPRSPAAVFEALSASGTDLPVASCHEVLVTPVSGAASVGVEHLAVGDVLAIRGDPDTVAHKLFGQGVALVVSAEDTGCVTRMRPVRADHAPELTFMGGTMHAHLDVEDPDVASFYLGRLAGTAGVEEHAHDHSWEVLCAVEASGTLTLEGAEARLGPLMCISVRPGSKHSWKPDTGSTLRAVQVYDPPGPELRFKKLAADERAGDR